MLVLTIIAVGFCHADKTSHSLQILEWGKSLFLGQHCPMVTIHFGPMTLWLVAWPPLWTQHGHFMSSNPGPHSGSVDTPHESMQGRHPRLSRLCLPSTLHRPDTSKALPLSSCRICQSCSYSQFCVIQWSDTPFSPFNRPSTEKAHPALCTMGLEEAQDGPGCLVSDPPRTKLFSFLRVRKTLFRNAEAGFLPFRRIHSNRKQSTN